MYPALVNCTTIDWFSEWPRDALLEVAEKYLEGVDLGEVDEVFPLSQLGAPFLGTQNCGPNLSLLI